MSQDSIADANKPSPGRMYDYILGGSHNFEVDRQAAEQVRKLLPFVPKYARLQRWALQDLAVELTERRGFDLIIDFASGLPTNDHIHNNVPEGTTVIYSDYDPIVVEYAREILGDTPNVYFFQADARQPQELIERPEVEQILAGRRRVGLVYWGVSAFMEGEDLRRVARFFYDWSSPDSCWAFNIQSLNRDDPVTKQMIEIYNKLGVPASFHTPEEAQALLAPWRPDGDGFISLIEWHGFDQSELSPEDIQSFGSMGGGYGAYLIK